MSEWIQDYYIILVGGKLKKTCVARCIISYVRMDAGLLHDPCGAELIQKACVARCIISYVRMAAGLLHDPCGGELIQKACVATLTIGYYRGTTDYCMIHIGGSYNQKPASLRSFRLCCVKQAKINFCLLYTTKPLAIHQRLFVLSGRLDSNQRPLAPHASALPGCATSRKFSPAFTSENLTG
jgi:hypothetical protein